MSILKAENSKKIGFCDSGVGGLTVYSKFRKLINSEDIIFYGDLKHSPYGNKSKEELISYSRNVFDFFKEQGVKAVVMACNTTSASTYPIIKNEYDFKIYPIIQSCAKIFANMGINKLGIFATESTIKSGVYESEIHKYNSNVQIYSQSCPNWVNIVESNSQEDKGSVDIIKSDLDKMLANNPDKIILGCTHYPFLLDILCRYAPPDMFIDPADYFVNYIIEDLKNSDLIDNSFSHKGSEEFYVSANPDKFKVASKMFYNVSEVKLKELD